MPRPRLSLTPLGASPASPTLLNSTFGDVAGGEVVGGVVVGVGAFEVDGGRYVEKKGAGEREREREAAGDKAEEQGAVAMTIAPASLAVDANDANDANEASTSAPTAAIPPPPSVSGLTLELQGIMKRQKVMANSTKKNAKNAKNSPKYTNSPRVLSKTLLESLMLHEIRALDRLAHLKESTMTVKRYCWRRGVCVGEVSTPRKEVGGWLRSDGLDGRVVLQSRLVLHTMCLQLHEGLRVVGRRRTEKEYGEEAGAEEYAAEDSSSDSEGHQDHQHLPVRVLPDVPLYLGGGSSARRLDVLKARGISYVVNVSAVVPNYHEGIDIDIGAEGVEGIGHGDGCEKISYVKVPVYDASDVDIVGALKEQGALEFIQEGLDAGCGVLVHCCAGRSRSVACVIAYLVRRFGWTVEEALEVVGRVRVVRPNDGFMEQLRGFYAEEVGGGGGGGGGGWARGS